MAGVSIGWRRIKHTTTMQKQTHTTKQYDQERLDTLSWLRFPLIVGVVFAHCNIYALVESWEGTAPEWPAWIEYLFTYFHWIVLPARVPLLFIISGYLFFRTQKPRNKAFFADKYRRRTHSLFIPYIAWNTIAIAILYLRFNIIDGCNYSLPDYLSGYWNFILREGGDPANGPLWFMRDLMVVSLLAPLLHIFIKKRTTGIIFLAATTICYAAKTAIPITGFSNVAILFFSIGAYLATHNIDFTKIPTPIGIITTILYFPIQFFMNSIDENSPYIDTMFLVTCIVKITATLYIVSLLFRKGVLHPTPGLTKLCFILYSLHGIIIGPIIKTAYFTLNSNNNPFTAILIFFSTPVVIIAITALSHHLLTRYTPRLAAILGCNRR